MHTRVLTLCAYAATPAAAGGPTMFRVENVADAEAVRVRCDGAEFTAWAVLGPRTVELRLDVSEHDVEVVCGTRRPSTPGGRSGLPRPP